jgi:cellobiose-specific phosphotransferase system component IIB
MPSLRLDIDPLRLDDELIGQPRQRGQFGELHADAQKDLDDAKANLSVAEAEADRDIRENPGDYGIVTLHPAVKVALKKVNEAKYKLNVLQAAIDGLEHRKRALSDLVTLHGQDYFAVPRMPTGIKAENRKREKDESDHDDD